MLMPTRMLRAATASPAIALAAVLVLACDPSGVAAPDAALTDDPDPAFARGSSPVIEQHVDLVPLGPAAVAGRAWLTRSADGIWLELEARGDDVEADDAFTTWAVLFHNPAACSGGCGADDLGDPAVGPMVMNFGGGFDADGDAMLEVDEGSAHLDRHSTAGKQVLLPGPDAPPGTRSGVRNPYRVEVHVILRNHGQKEDDPADRADQTSLVGAFCNLDEAGRPDTDVGLPTGADDGCADQAVAIFTPPGAPGANRSN